MPGEARQGIDRWRCPPVRPLAPRSDVDDVLRAVNIGRLVAGHRVEDAVAQVAQLLAGVRQFVVKGLAERRAAALRRLVVRALERLPGLVVAPRPAALDRPDLGQDRARLRSELDSEGLELESGGRDL